MMVTHVPVLIFVYLLDLVFLMLFAVVLMFLAHPVLVNKVPVIQLLDNAVTKLLKEPLVMMVLIVLETTSAMLTLTAVVLHSLVMMEILVLLMLALEDNAFTLKTIESVTMVMLVLQTIVVS